MQEEVGILLRQSEVVHPIGVVLVLGGLELVLLGSIDQPGVDVLFLGLVKHSDVLICRRLGGISVKPCIGGVGRGIRMRRMKDRIV